MFKRLYEKLTCMHDWQERYSCRWSDDMGGHWTQKTLICSKCGKIKQIAI